MQMFPQVTPAQAAEFNELLRLSAKPDHAARMVMATGRADVSALLPRVACPTLIFHCRGAPLMPVEEARFIASSVPNARFVSLDSDNYIPIKDEPAFTRLIEEFQTVSRASRPRMGLSHASTPRAPGAGAGRVRPGQLRHLHPAPALGKDRAQYRVEHFRKALGTEPRPSGRFRSQGRIRGLSGTGPLSRFSRSPLTWASRIRDNHPATAVYVCAYSPAHESTTSRVDTRRRIELRR